MNQTHSVPKYLFLLSLVLFGLLLSACNLAAQGTTVERLAVQAPEGSATATIPPTTPLPSLTPSQTLKPPPTFEPPTATLAPSLTPSATPTTELNVDISIPGLRGAESPTPSTTPGCKPREDWGLTYTVQPNDALARIAQQYGTYATTLAEGNCLSDANVIRVGQVLRVPGDSAPVSGPFECVPFELLTPANGTLAVEGEGNLTFNWRGPRAPRNLIRIHRPDGSIYERVIELRQNESIDLYEHLWQAGTYTWYVYPLDSNFVQQCPEGGPWTFTKSESPTATRTPTDIPDMSSGGNTGGGSTVIVVTATPAPTQVPTEEPEPDDTEEAPA